jgi:hypothetical protein
LVCFRRFLNQAAWSSEEEEEGEDDETLLRDLLLRVDL